MKNGYIYILQSSKNQQFYIGCTKNLKTKLNKHNKGYVTSTKHKRPWKLLFHQKYNSIKKARKIKTKLKI